MYIIRPYLNQEDFKKTRTFSVERILLHFAINVQFKASQLIFGINLAQKYTIFSIKSCSFNNISFCCLYVYRQGQHIWQLIVKIMLKMQTHE